MKTLLLAGAMMLALSLPSAAAPCTAPMQSLADDQVSMEAKDLPDYVYLGPRLLPFTDQSYVFYAFGGMVFASKIIDGCVSADLSRVGPYVPEHGI